MPRTKHPTRAPHGVDELLRAVIARNDGKTWKSIAQEFAYSTAHSAERAVRSWARKNGIELILAPSAVHARTPSVRVVEAYAAWQRGQTWEAIATKYQFIRMKGTPREKISAHNAMMAVRHYARRHGLPLRSGAATKR